MSVPDTFQIGVCVNEPTIDRLEDFRVQLYTRGLKRIAAHKGFDLIEYSHVAHLSLQEATQIGQITRTLGMNAWSIHSEHLNGNSPEQVEEYYRVQDVCACNAAAMGCRMFVFHPPNADFSGDGCVQIVGMIADICARHGLTAALENVNRKYPVRRLCDFVAQADRTNLGFTIDTGHAQIYEDGGAVATIRQMGSRIVTTHIQDTCGQTDDHLPPGMGAIDWRIVLSELWKTGYRGPLMVELTGATVKQRRGVESLRKVPLEVEQALTAAYLRFIGHCLRDSSTAEFGGPLA